MRVSEVAEAAQVNAETLRYYERRGLIAKPARSPGGHRRYDEHTVTTLRVIKAAQRLGFTLDEVAELLDVGRRRGPSSDFQVRAQQKLVEVTDRFDDEASWQQFRRENHEAYSRLDTETEALSVHEWDLGTGHVDRPEDEQ